MDIKPVVWFKYNPTKQRLVIECQPIKPYTIIDQVNVDKFCKEENSPNPGFRRQKPLGDVVIIRKTPTNGKEK